MKKIIAATLGASCLIWVGAAQAESNNAGTMNRNAPGTTGAMQNSNSNGIATDPNGVAAQQGRSSSASPGTVGAAPGADTPSQNPAQKPK